jgi:hypothetical protein
MIVCKSYRVLAVLNVFNSLILDRINQCQFPLYFFKKRIVCGLHELRLVLQWKEKTNGLMEQFVLVFVFELNEIV